MKELRWNILVFLGLNMDDARELGRRWGSGHIN